MALRRSTPAEVQKAPCSITTRALLLGAAIAVFNCYLVLQLELTSYAAQPTTISLYPHAFLVLLLLLALNQVLGCLRMSWTFSTGEILTVYFMSCVATSICSHDMVEILVPTVAHPYWFATEQNKWGDLFFRNLPDWLIVSDRGALTNYFAGGRSLWSSGTASVWLRPLVVWGFFGLVLFSALVCIAAVVRRQWTHAERLTYPLARVPVEFVAGQTNLFSERSFWWACAAVAAVDLMNGLRSLYYPFLPSMDLRSRDVLSPMITSHPWTALNPIRIAFYPFAIALCFLLPVDLLFSCWFFFWFWKLQRVLFVWLGRVPDPRYPYINEQAFGAYIAIALFALLGLVRGVKLFRIPPASDEPMLQRWALMGFSVCFVVLVGFSMAAGMHLAYALVFFTIYFLISLSVGRIRGQLGPPAHDLHAADPGRIITDFLGTRHVSKADLTVFNLYHWFNRAYRAHPLPHLLEGWRSAELTGLSMRSLCKALGIAALIGMVGGFVLLLYICHDLGAGTGKMVGPVTWFGWEPYNRLAYWISNPEGPSTGAILGTVWGTAFGFFLLWMRTLFTWWPFHPVGYAISNSWSMEQLWLPVLITWVVKVAVMRYAGLRGYRVAIPAFMGMLAGETVMAGVWGIWGVVLRQRAYNIWPY